MPNKQREYELERARTYRAEAQTAIEYILVNDDTRRAELILNSIKRSLAAELKLRSNFNAEYLAVSNDIMNELAENPALFEQLDFIRKKFHTFIANSKHETHKIV
ncbi:hypothetical protein SAMN05216431_1046 [Ligilactobacillus sp. WC1T17]|uniref:Uncharacterized protein n=1 Tax=Ligilactobacillus ruminis TaxID=1623 RepID=A0ABY1AAH4_9LACO|nr:hypothetical protein SAMN05216431_1046 [Ligilactobacillus ruminis]